MGRIALGALAVFAIAGAALADDCSEVCPNCSADPVFVQPDLRRPMMPAVVRRLASPRMRREGVHLLVVLSEEQDGRLQDTVVLHGEQGRVENVTVRDQRTAELLSALLGKR
jgi:hypothetical protein